MFRQHEDEDRDSTVLLFLLASGSGLPVIWDDCCRLHIWIEAKDLAAQHFDRIRATVKW